MRSKNALYNIASNLLLQIIVVLYGFIVPKIIINSFGSNVNGLISSITQFLAYITLLESGFGPVVKSTLYKPISEKDDKTIANILKTTEKFFRKISIIFLVYISILCCLYPLLIKDKFEGLYVISLIIIIGISTFAEYFFGMTYRLYLQARQKTYVISCIQIVSYVLSIIFIIFLARIGASVQIIKLISSFAFVLRPILQNWYVKKKYKICFDEAEDNYILEQKWAGLAQHIATVIHSNTDVTILTIFCTLKEVSVYTVYYLVVKGVKAIIQAFNSGMDASFGDMIAKNEFDNLNKKYKIYELFYHSISSIIFISTIILIIPFIKVYTKGINDVNYIRPVFGVLLAIAEFLWAIRLPYSSLTLAAGHFKETQKGAWIEAISNILVSCMLVSYIGITGVAIGTIIAMTLRTLEFMYYTSKHILKRNLMNSFKWIFTIFIEALICVLFFNYISKYIVINSYYSWILFSIIVVLVSSVIVLPINFITNREQVKGLKTILKR